MSAEEVSRDPEEESRSEDDEDAPS